MEIDKDQLISRYTTPTTNARSERAEIVQKFTDRINEGREGTAFKAMTPRAVAIKLSLLPTDDLHAFFQQCDRAKCFSAYFFWALKPQPVDKPPYTK